jgi:SWI/SNF related-matrix-associated actin-dependent regulator of chromatin subfamily C
MEEDSMNFGSDAAGATPGSNSILAQPPLPDESSPSGQQSGSNQGEIQTAEGARVRYLWCLDV